MYMPNEELFTFLKREDLSTDLQLIWDCAGEETVRSLLNNVAGIRVYIPMRTGMPSLMNRVIKELAKTQEAIAISQMLGVSVKYVNDTLSGKGKAG